MKLFLLDDYRWSQRRRKCKTPLLVPQWNGNQWHLLHPGHPKLQLPCILIEKKNFKRYELKNSGKVVMHMLRSILRLVPCPSRLIGMLKSHSDSTMHCNLQYYHVFLYYIVIMLEYEFLMLFKYESAKV